MESAEQSPRYTKHSLRRAIEARQPLPVIRSVVEGRPRSVQETSSFSDKNRFPLVLASLYYGSQSFSEASEPSEEGEAAVAVSVIQYLYNSWPKAIYKTDRDGLLLIHGVAPSWSIDVVRFFVRAWPGSLRKRGTKCGRLPLHCAVSSGCGREIVQFLLESRPASVQVPDDDGRLPLHYCCSRTTAATPDLSVVELLVNAWPPSVRMADTDRCLPLHRAVDASCQEMSMDVARYLVQQWPESVRHRDSHGRLPLHWLAQHHDGPSALEVASTFLDLWPESVRVADAVSGSLPLHGAVARRSLELSRLFI
jgi:Ankyrin repeats (3 copies)